MTDKKLSTDSYKGVRDFYPEDMAIQRYMFQTWSKTAESFGFERYDASILEPSDLYRAKGAQNNEIVNEQTYTFTDRGDREVTLRPEMTPTIARMVAAKHRELSFPLRWYSIPNLYRYERPQRGRLREHWQLNCDIFGADHYSADVELIALAYQTLIDFGAKSEMFEIKINNSFAVVEFMQLACDNKLNDEQVVAVRRLIDRYGKIDNFDERMDSIVGGELAPTILEAYSDPVVRKSIYDRMETSKEIQNLSEGLSALGIKVTYDHMLVRGFDYYTGTIFEIFDVSGENNRALLGGGRYDNLTSMFDGEAISGIGFGMGDVTMRDFLETHKLIPEYVRSTAAHVVVIPITYEQNLFAEGIAMKIRHAGHKVTTDISTKKVGKKITDASNRGSKFVTVIGEDEKKSEIVTVKNLHSGEERTGKLAELMNFLDVE